MSNNLIHNYLNNMNNSSTQKAKKSDRSYFGVPSVSSTIEAFDQESDRLIKPLDGKGHLVNGDLVHMPKEFVRDTVYTAKAFADGVRGKANDHQLGKLNDLGLKLSGLAIATYLMTKKATPKTKAMEFVGFGAFLASMALWPKVALEIPARIVHGFNFRKKYIDEQGRKKDVSLDPNYIPFDLYKGDKKSEDLDVIGDRAGIRRDIPNRHEAVKEHIRKVSVQNNTLWMLTAGIATPIMTALACNKAEPFIGRFAEKYTNKKVNTQIDEIDNYLNNKMDNNQSKLYETKVLGINSGSETTPVMSDTSKLLKTYKGKIIKTEDIAKIADTLAAGLEPELKDAAREDVENLIGGQKYIANEKTADSLASSIHSAISAKDAELANKITPDKIKSAASQGIIRGAVRDLLTSVGFDIVDNESKFGDVSHNFKCADVNNCDFFKETPETANMTPVEKLAHNIKSIIMKVNNSNTSEDFIPGMSELEQQNKGLKFRIDGKLQSGADEIAQNFFSGELAIGERRENYVREAIQKLYEDNAPKDVPHRKLFRDISKILTEDSSTHRGYSITEGVADKLAQADKHLRKYSAVDRVLAETAHFKVEKASETLVANNWAEVSDLLVKELKIDEKQMALAAKDQNYSKQLLAEKLETVCSDETSYKNFVTNLAKKMAELDEKIDEPNPQSSGRMMNKIEAGIERNCADTGKALGELGLDSMKEKLYGVHDGTLDRNIGSVMSSKTQRLHSRVNGVHSSYMRLLQSAEFFHRVHRFNSEVASNTGRSVEQIADSFGLPQDKEMRDAIIKKGKNVLLDSHTDDFYTKLGYHNNKNCFETFFWSVFKPNKGSQWDANWNNSTEGTINILNEIKSVKDSAEYPRRVFEGSERKQLGQKLKEHMNQIYNSLGSIERQTVGDNRERIRVGGVSPSDKRACERFDLLGKSPNDFLHDTLKQKYNSNKWMKMFAPVLAATFGVTVIAQFFFGKKDSDIKS